MFFLGLQGEKAGEIASFRLENLFSCLENDGRSAGLAPRRGFRGRLEVQARALRPGT